MTKLGDLTVPVLKSKKVIFKVTYKATWSQSWSRNLDLLLKKYFGSATLLLTTGKLIAVVTTINEKLKKM